MLNKLKIQALVLSLAACCMFGVVSVHAQELKIAYVDIQTALENTSEYQSGMKRLKALNDQKVKELSALGEKIKEAEKEFMRQSLTMSPANRAQRQEGLKTMGKNFQRMQQDAQEELGAAKNRLDITSGTKFKKVLIQYGKDHHYDMIVRRTSFLYADPKHDITGDITKLLDD